MNQKEFENTAAMYNQLATATEKLQFLVSFGIRASSPHNSQPWTFTISENTITVRADMRYYLPVADPSKRELYMSIGTAAANIVMAAEALGLQFKKNTDLDINNNPSIAIEFSSLDATTTANTDTKLRAIQFRHNNRSAFAGGDIPHTIQDRILSIATENNSTCVLYTDQDKIRQTQILLGQAVKAAFKDRQFTQELSRWVKPSFPWYREGLPGYSMHVPWLLSLVLPFMVRFKDISAVQQKIHEAYLNNVSAIGILTVPDEKQPTVLAQTGEAFERIAVFLESENIKIGVMQAPIEVENFRENLRTLLTIQEVPVLFFRVGYSTRRPKTSPRRPLASFLSI